MSTTTTTRTTTKTTTTTTVSTTTTRSTIAPSSDGSGGAPSGSPIKSLGPICRGAYKFLSCPRGSEIRILNVFYGRKDSDTCVSTRSRRTVSNCNLPGADSYVRSRCDGRSGCWIFHGLFPSDPCPGTDKYVNVIYKCDTGM